MTQISLKKLMEDAAPSYPESVARPSRDELTRVHFKELLMPADVDAALNRMDDNIILVLLNSVCGCAARSARPGTILSMLNTVVPDEYISIFAGMEKEAVAHFREKYLPGLSPSSPNIALFKNGKLLYLLQRHMIEGKTAAEISRELVTAFNEFCSQRNSMGEADPLKKFIENNYRESMENPAAN